MLKSSLDNAMQHLANLKNKNKNATLEASSNDGQKNVLKQGSKINRPAAYDAAMMSQLAAGGASSIQSKPGITLPSLATVGPIPPLCVARFSKS